MSPKSQQPWIPIERIENAVRLDAALVILGLALVSFFVYKMLLSRVSEERHQNLRKLFWNLFGYMSATAVLLVSYWHLDTHSQPDTGLKYLAGYVGLAALVAGAIVLIKTSRILLFEYLFFGHMKQGVPLLLVNLLSLILSIIVFSWFATEIFAFQVTSLLATSAMFSVVIGLALQDTLGNLFAGAALQFDKPYEIGDWVEVSSGPTKWVGIVHEISWRATILIGFSDEFITIPNRVMAQAHISNFAAKRIPIARSQVFRIPYGSDIELARKKLMEVASSVSGIRAQPRPSVLLQEAHESWVQCKLLYFIDNYGEQYIIGDQVLEKGINALKSAGIPLAPPRLSIIEEIKGSGRPPL